MLRDNAHEVCMGGGCEDNLGIVRWSSGQKEN